MRGGPRSPSGSTCLRILRSRSWFFLFCAAALLSSQSLAPRKPSPLTNFHGLALSMLAQPPPQAGPRRVRDYCRWSRLPWEAREKLVRWSTPVQNFTHYYFARPNVDGVFTLHVEGCDMSWVTQRSARQCLAALGHVVVVGDSISRLLYMSLVHFLHTGSFAPLDDEHPPSDAPRAWTKPSPREDPSPLDLPHYFAATSARLNGTEICDCYVGMYHTENRYYREAGVDISYVSFFSHAHGLRLHSPGWLNAFCARPPCLQTGCAVGACADDASPPQHFVNLQAPADDLAVLVDLLRPDVLLLNAGHHRSLDTEEGKAEIARVARRMGEGEAARARERERWRASLDAALAAGQEAPQRDLGLGAAWEALRAAPPLQAAAAPAPQQPPQRSASGSARNFIWRTTTPRKDPDGVWAGVLSAERSSYPGAPLLGPTPAAPRGPWPSYEASILEAVGAEGGRGFDAFTLLWPLLMLARAEGRDEPISAVFSHPHDALHFAPGVHSQLNRALLSMLCEDFEGVVG